MTPDKFEKFESTIPGWIARHKLITFGVVGIFIAVLIISLSVMVVTSITGMEYANVNITERHNAELISSNQFVSEEEYANWNNLCIPLYLFCLHFIECFGVSIPIMCLTTMIYFVARQEYRKTHTKYNEPIKKSSNRSCATCTNKESVGDENYEDIGYFYANKNGVMRCTIDGTLISMEIYHKIDHVGCVSFDHAIVETKER